MNSKSHDQFWCSRSNLGIITPRNVESEVCLHGLGPRSVILAGWPRGQERHWNHRRKRGRDREGVTSSRPNDCCTLNFSVLLHQGMSKQLDHRLSDSKFHWGISEIPLLPSSRPHRCVQRNDIKSRCHRFCSVLHNYKGDVNDSYFPSPAHSCEVDGRDAEEFSMTHLASSFLQWVGRGHLVPQLLEALVSVHSQTQMFLLS